MVCARGRRLDGCGSDPMGFLAPFQQGQPYGRGDLTPSRLRGRPKTKRTAMRAQGGGYYSLVPHGTRTKRAIRSCSARANSLTRAPSRPTETTIEPRRNGFFMSTKHLLYTRRDELEKKHQHIAHEQHHDGEVPQKCPKPGQGYSKAGLSRTDRTQHQSESARASARSNFRDSIPQGTEACLHACTIPLSRPILAPSQTGEAWAAP